MTTIITIANQKGGVGKTTTAAHLAHGLSIKGKNVLMIDLDAQGNLTALFGVKRKKGASVLLLADNSQEDTDNVLRYMTQVRDHLWLIPGSIETSSAQTVISSENRPYTCVRDTLTRFFSKELHYIVIDTAPTVGGVQERAIWASDLLIVPTQLEGASGIGLVDTMLMINDLRTKAGWKGNFLGILPTMYAGNIDSGAFMPREQKIRLEDMATLGTMLTPIPRRTAVSECTTRTETIFEFDPRGEASEAYGTLVNLVLKTTR